MIRLAAIIVGAALAFSTATAGALAQAPAPQAGAAETAKPVRIGYLGLTDDPRHAAFYANTEIELAPADDPTLGAQLAIEDGKFMTSAVGVDMSLDVQRAKDVAGLMDTLKAMVGAGERFVLVDLPGDLLDKIAAQAKGMKVTLINISAPDNDLRSACYPELLDTAASDRMETDALVQFLVKHNWTKVLILEGSTARDKAFAQSFADSARRLRLNIVDTREFTLSKNPVQRTQNNTLLITSNADYDVVFVADTGLEFARYLPYATQLARPVIGSTGLVASEWHWTWDENGAPQVLHRFLDLSKGVKMTDTDWAAWIAVKSVIQAYLRAGSTDPEKVDAYLRSDKLAADGSKGKTQSYRPWSGQMRQPLLLHTADAVIATAPIAGFEHRTNDLDTLGLDQPESKCR